MPQILNISFVQAKGGVPDRDDGSVHRPRLQCQVHTTFGGSIDGDVIVGEFTIERMATSRARAAKGAGRSRGKKA